MAVFVISGIQIPSGTIRWSWVEAVPVSVDALLYDTSTCVYDTLVFIYPDRSVLVFSDEVLYFGEEPLIYEIDSPYVAEGYFEDGYIKENIV